jgi:site-specific DNA-cytosine methylase
MLDASDDESADWTLLDFFCGGGTLSFAARDAGMRVGVGVDNSADALSVFKLNSHAPACTVPRWVPSVLSL